MTLSTTADAGQGPPGRRSAPPRRRRLVIGVTAALVGLVVLLGVDAAQLTSRIDRFDTLSLADGPGTTWVLVGLDNRADLPDGASVDTFGTPERVPGSRADVVVVLQQTPEGMTVLSVPRDVVIRSAGRPTRLALTWLQGPQATIDALCSLGIPTEHLVSVDLAGFAAVVDAAGGLEVDIPAPVRDPGAGLLLPDAGRQHVDGTTALALVRSRHPESLVDGVWTPASVDPDGRATAAGTVLAALASAARSSVWRPWQLQRVAWAASGALTVDDGTSVPELVSLATAHLDPVQVLPVGPPAGGTVARLPVPETAQAVAAAGLSCTR
jgi:LCP family protein required for cell wall assembly